MKQRVAGGCHHHVLACVTASSQNQCQSGKDVWTVSRTAQHAGAKRDALQPGGTQHQLNLCMTVVSCRQH